MRGRAGKRLTRRPRWNRRQSPGNSHIEEKGAAESYTLATEVAEDLDIREFPSNPARHLAEDRGSQQLSGNTHPRLKAPPSWVSALP